MKQKRTIKEQYERAKEDFKRDKSISERNKDLVLAFLKDLEEGKID